MRSVTPILIVALALGACSPPSSDASNCPITIPTQPGCVPPDSHPPEPSGEGSVWYGSSELWTVLRADGSYVPRKSVWWSNSFTDPRLEPSPNIAVVWHRLDIPVDDLSNTSAAVTNGSTPEDGLFIIAGLDPDGEGCWEVTATYKGATLSYTFEKTSSGSD